MKIGIIGSGNIGGTLGIKWGEAGHSVLFASRNPGQLQSLVDAAGPTAMAGSLDDAANFGDVILIATPFKAWPDIAANLASLLQGKTVIDASNVYPERDGAIAQQAIDTGKGSGAFVQALLPSIHIVKAFNTLYYKTLGDGGGLGTGIPIAGNNKASLSTVSSLVRAAGFVPVIVGDISRARDFDPGTPVYAKTLPSADLARALGGTPINN